MHYRPLPSLSLVFLCAALCCLSVPAIAEEDKEPKFSDEHLEFFEKEVRPLLIKRCYECHSANAKELQGSLQLDSRKAALIGGDLGPAIVPGKPKESLLVDVINWGDTYQMPPKQKMPAAEIAVLTKWVELGAPWPAGEKVKLVQSDFNLNARRDEHWCWQPIQNPALPKVRATEWPRQDLDRFILARLEAAGLKPNGEADRRVLIRRLYMDLIGLPPSPEEVTAFVNDKQPDAYEKLVDKLLASEHFGERWARHWLDLVRYGESCGHEFDYPIPEAWRYRDYVIRAFNDDVPYDQFVIEHLAGDLLEKPRVHKTDGTNESILATGFWWLGESVHAPVDVRGNEAGIIDNQIDVFSKTFLGVAVSCARCHDHKFDAISTKDYYAIAGMLQSSRRNLALLDPQGKIAAAKRDIVSLREEGSQVVGQAAKKFRDEFTSKQASLSNLFLAACSVSGDKKTVADAAKQHGVEPTAVEKLVAALAAPPLADRAHPLHLWQRLGKLSAADAEAFAQERQRILAEADKLSKQNDGIQLLADFANNGKAWFATGYTMDADQRPLWDGSPAVQVGLDGVADSGQWAPQLQGVLRSPTFTLSHRHIDYKVRGQGQIRLIIEGYDMDVYNGLLFRGCNMGVNTKGKTIWMRQGGDISRYVGRRCHIELIDHGGATLAVDEIRLTDRAQPQPEYAELALESLRKSDSLAAFAKSFAAAVDAGIGQATSGQRPAATTAATMNWLFATNPTSVDLAELNQRVAELRQRIDARGREIPGPIKAQAITDGSAENERVFIRGNHRVLGDVVPRRLLTALGGEKNPISSARSGRMDFAKQVVDPKNPLTARVISNRLWHHLTGRGIVASVDNFGVLGQVPTHPQLLDHLSTRLIDEGWSLKRMIREIVTSSTYRMSSAPNEAGTRVDPTNKWLHRMRIRRLQGEVIRDTALAVSGRLQPRMFGPSVPVHVTAFMQGRGRPGSGPLDGKGRRSIYVSVKRNFLSPLMLAFDTPVPFSTMGRRNTSNVPAQALIMMNNPLIVDLSKSWARQLLTKQVDSPADRIELLYLQAYSRPPSDAELAAATQFLAAQGKQYGLTEAVASKDPRVWADLCHVMMNVKEFIYLR